MQQQEWSSLFFLSDYIWNINVRHPCTDIQPWKSTWTTVVLVGPAPLSVSSSPCPVPPHSLLPSQSYDWHLAVPLHQLFDWHWHPHLIRTVTATMLNVIEKQIIHSFQTQIQYKRGNNHLIPEWMIPISKETVISSYWEGTSSNATMVAFCKIKSALTSGRFGVEQTGLLGILLDPYDQPTWLQ